MNDEAAAHYSAIIDNMAIGIKFLQVDTHTLINYFSQLTYIYNDNPLVILPQHIICGLY